ncbi:MAG TPA: NAD(P)H-hydrate dehydratase, partial [Solirubrobacterales bacterium]|nr:NAD(P)H-hydrate dehydratase [Solirubrobacterales bacterium]
GPDSAEAATGALERAAAAVIGSGMGRDSQTAELIRSLVATAPCPLVIDADGLNAFAARPADLATRPAPAAPGVAPALTAPTTVLTPHAGELGRLLDIPSAEVSRRRLAHAAELARASAATVVLKGDDTIITDGRRLAVNTLAAPALATAGTGDVLAGVIAALIARGLADPFEAACMAVHAHARAGRLAAECLGNPDSVIATDVIAALPAALTPARDHGSTRRARSG